MYCPQCNSSHPVGDYPEGCPKCARAGSPACVVPQYRSIPNWREVLPSQGLTQYIHRLPFTVIPSIGEGNTPQWRLPALADNFGLAGLSVKNEGDNPTGSHKDRMSPLVIAAAIRANATAVAVASSGNAGVSLSAAARHSKMDCVIVADNDMAPEWRDAIKHEGGQLVFTQDRWKQLKELREEGLYPATNYLTPPVGSNCFGVEGYKTIAYEIVDSTEAIVPDWIVVPCSRGDLLWGTWLGFEELFRYGAIDVTPRMVAVEPFPRLARVLRGESYVSFFSGSTRLRSIGGNSVTFQLKKAVEDSDGTVSVVSDRKAIEWQRRLKSWCITAESSSASVFAAIEALCTDGTFGKQDSVMAILTSSGRYEQVWEHL